MAQKVFDIPPLGPNIKSTFGSFTSAAIACIVAFTSLPAGAKWPVVTLAILHALNGLLQKDAGVTEAVTLTGDVKTVPSHEVPDDPTAKPITTTPPAPHTTAEIAQWAASHNGSINVPKE